jgi:hypothetical protein
MNWFDKPEVIGPDSDGDRIAALEARVSALEARLAQPPPPLGSVPTAPAAGDDETAIEGADETGAWLDQVATLAATGERAHAIALYREGMAADEEEAASFVDDLIRQPPSTG